MQVCGGDNSTCKLGKSSRCNDTNACNFNPAVQNGTANDGDCVYAPRGFDCSGKCEIRRDCYGVCGGRARKDRCGVCEGDHTSCVGCKDRRACNYDPKVTKSLRHSCTYALPYHDCSGTCLAEYDCQGNCAGKALVDRCGVCDGDGSSCAGCLDAAACNYDAEFNFSNPASCEYPPPNFNCEGDCISVKDRCGVCGGDNSTCGCTDPTSCNYDAGALHDDGSCSYVQSLNHTCDGTCLVDIDCHGVCGGPSVADVCGVCEGDGSTCEFCPPLCTTGRYSPKKPCRTQVSVWGWCQERHPSDSLNILIQPEFDEMDKATQTLSIRQREISGELVSCTRCKPKLADAVMLPVDPSTILEDCWDPEICTCSSDFALRPAFRAPTNASCLAECVDDPSCGYAFIERAGCHLYFDCLYSRTPLNPGSTFRRADWESVEHGCTDSHACNYNSSVNHDDGTCSYPLTNYDCDGQCAVGLDCHGVCGGAARVDPCGICEGDGSTCGGCLDPAACNFDTEATVDDGSCFYANSTVNCEGACLVNIDCEGVCGGSAEFDRCNVCNGDGQSCIVDYIRPDTSLLEEKVCQRRGMQQKCTCSLEYALQFVMQLPLMVKKVNMLIPCSEEKCTDTCLQKKDCKYGFYIPTSNTCYLYSDCPTDSLRFASNEGVSFVKASGLSGCRDPKGCNFSPLAQIRNDSLCRYPEPFHDCNGVCVGGFDCAGICGGTTTFDLCGECGGNSTQCAVGQMTRYDVRQWQEEACTAARESAVDASVLANHDAVASCACASPFQRFKLKLFPAMDQTACSNRCLNEPRCKFQSFDDRYCSLFEDCSRVHLTTLGNVQTYQKEWQGCTNPDACNFFPLATIDNATCHFPKPMHNCNDECLVEVDCAGECGGKHKLDRCGVCGGDGKSCVGCMEPTACNFDSSATIPDASLCVHRKEFHDCDGNCQRDVDCNGVCGGGAVVDKCGVCGGDSTSCDFGILEKSIEEAAKRDELARAQRLAAVAAQKEQIAKLEAQVIALRAALGDSDATGTVAMLQQTIDGMRQQLDSDERALSQDPLSIVDNSTICSQDACHGYSCDQWIISFATSCMVLETEFDCDCSGCKGCAGAGSGTHRGNIDESAIAHLASPPPSELLSSDEDDGLPAGWFSAVDTASGKVYFYNAHGETRWDRPVQPVQSSVDDGDASEAGAAAVTTTLVQPVVEERPKLPDGVLPPLFFSEHISGPGKQCVIEIFNPARFPVPAGLYTLRVANSEKTSQWQSVPDLALPWDVIVDPGETLVLATSMATFRGWGKVKNVVTDSVTLKGLKCGSSYALALVYDGDVMDVVGDITQTVDRGFEVAGIGGATHGRTIARREFVGAPSSHWNVSAGTNSVNSEWVVEEGQQNPNNLGHHTSKARIVEYEIDASGVVSTTEVHIKGCTRKDACNYYSKATRDDGSCRMPLRYHDCESQCIVQRDCHGVCGGRATIDACGICGGDGQSCVEKPCISWERHTRSRAKTHHHVFNLTDCRPDEDTDPGFTCTIRCNDGYFGEDATFECPPKNTNERMTLQGTWPTCLPKMTMTKIKVADHFKCWKRDACSCASSFKLPTSQIVRLHNNVKSGLTRSQVCLEECIATPDCQYAFVVDKDDECHLYKDCKETRQPLNHGKTYAKQFVDGGGCKDIASCNYNSTALFEDDSCEYPKQNHDCSGRCLVALDCTGKCGGSATVDVCGVCQGSASSIEQCEPQAPHARRASETRRPPPPPKLSTENQPPPPPPPPRARTKQQKTNTNTPTAKSLLSRSPPPPPPPPSRKQEGGLNRGAPPPPPPPPKTQRNSASNNDMSDQHAAVPPPVAADDVMQAVFDSQHVVHERTIGKWDNADVVQWLTNLALPSRVIATFSEWDVDGAMLLELDDVRAAGACFELWLLLANGLNPTLYLFQNGL